jgi:arylsulfatase A-like enzyme
LLSLAKLRQRGRAARLASALLALAVPAGVGCTGNGAREPAATPGRAAPAIRGPVLVIALQGLRADAVESLGGLPGLTPHLDALIAESDWAGPAVAPSNGAAAATTSLLTGLLPSQHGVGRDGAAALPPGLTTLAEAFRALGYESHGYLSSDWMRRAAGYGQGFDRVEPLGAVRGVERELARADGGRRLVWVDLALPAAPYRRYPNLLPRLDELGDLVAGEGLPERIGRGTVQRARQRGEPLAPSELRRWRALYALNVARADQRVGQLLDALRASGRWEEATVAVVSTRGQELGDYGSVAEGRSLRRKLVEVPLAVKLPADLRGRIRLPEPGTTVGTVALWSTLVELAGGRRPPAVAAGLHELPEAQASGVLSELRAVGGLEQVSWVAGGDQLLRTRPRARATEVAPEESRGWRWWAGGEEQALEDPDRLAELARDLERARLLAAGDQAAARPLDSPGQSGPTGTW